MVNINGYFIRGVRTLDKLQAFNEKVFDVVNKKASEIYERIMLDKTEKILDEFFLNDLQYGESNAKLTPFSMASAIFRNEHIKSMMMDEKSLFNLSFSYGFKKVDDKILALIFTDNEELVEAWESINEVQDFSWSSESKVSTMKDRGKYWKKALEPNWIPMGNFNFFEVVSKHLTFTTSSEDMTFRDIQSRAFDFAKHRLLVKEFQDRIKDKKIKEGDLAKLKEEVESYFEDGKGLKKVENLAEEYERKLKNSNEKFINTSFKDIKDKFTVEV